MIVTDVFEKEPWNKKMKILRISKGWNQTKAGKECGVDQQYYSLLENGKVYPQENNQKAIALAFEVSKETIFEEKSEVEKCIQI